MYSVKYFYINKKGLLYLQFKDNLCCNLSGAFAFVRKRLCIYGDIVKQNKNGVYLRDWRIEKR